MIVLEGHTEGHYICPRLEETQRGNRMILEPVLVPCGNWTKLLIITIFNGKIHYKWPFSTAMLNYWRIRKSLILFVPSFFLLLLLLLLLLVMWWVCVSFGIVISTGTRASVGRYVGGVGQLQLLFAWVRRTPPCMSCAMQCVVCGPIYTSSGKNCHILQGYPGYVVISYTII